MAEQDFWLSPGDIPLDLTLLYNLGDTEDEQVYVYTTDGLNTNFARPCFAIANRGSEDMFDLAAVIEETLHRILDAGGTPEDVYRIMGLVPEEEILEEDVLDSDQYTPIDLGYCVVGNLASFEGVPDAVVAAANTLTAKQEVQFIQAIDHYEIPFKDAMRLTEHEYDGFQARAICKAAANPAIPRDVLNSIADPRFAASQMTALAKIAANGGDLSPYLDPQMDAKRMDAAYRVLLHGGKDFPLKSLDLDQLRTLNGILLRRSVPQDMLAAIAKPQFSPESMVVIAAAMEGENYDPRSGEPSLTASQVGRILTPDYTPSQQIALLTAMRGQTPVANLSDADFKAVFPPELPVEKMNACAYAVNRCGYNTPLLMMTMQACADMNAQQLMAVFDAAAAELADANMAKVSSILMYSPDLSSQQMRMLLTEAKSGTQLPELASIKESFVSQTAPEPEQATVDIKSESHDMSSGRDALGEQMENMDAPEINQSKEMD